MYRCDGVTKNNRSCANRVRYLGVFCYIHIDQDVFALINMRNYVAPDEARADILRK